MDSPKVWCEELHLGRAWDFRAVLGFVFFSFLPFGPPQRKRWKPNQLKGILKFLSRLSEEAQIHMD